jgi:hypothetical protein
MTSSRSRCVCRTMLAMASGMNAAQFHAGMITLINGEPPLS